MSTKPAVALRLAAVALLSLTACARQSQPPAPAPAADAVDIGYGSQPKDKVTGAVTALSDRELGNQPLRIEELLRGKVAGLQIIQTATGVTFRIRGGATSLSSELADQEPLIVVDGVMIPTASLNSALAGLTRDDIKQVSVLKDVASTSIYGFRGGGGVILITTKR